MCLVNGRACERWTRRVIWVVAMAAVVWSLDELLSSTLGADTALAVQTTPAEIERRLGALEAIGVERELAVLKTRLEEFQRNWTERRAEDLAVWGSIRTGVIGLGCAIVLQLILMIFGLRQQQQSRK